MEQSTLKSKLQKEIFFNSALVALVVVVGFSVGLFVYHRFNIQHQLRVEREYISGEYSLLIDEVRDSLIADNNNLLSAFILGEATERNIFTAYYGFLIDSVATPRGGRFFILNEDEALVFDSDGRTELDRRLALHLSILINNIENEPFIQHVFLPANRESYLVLLGKVFCEDNLVVGHAVFLVGGNRFLPEPSMAGVQYVIFDRHNSVFSRSASLFIQSSIYKVDDILRNRSFTYEQQQFFTQHIPLSENMQLVVYIQDNHGSVLFTVFFIANALIAAALMIQSKLYSKKIIESNIKHIELLTHESERKRLESQFDVHFLFNTLEAARAYMSFDPKLANDLILSLNTTLRYSIDENKTETTLADDLEYLKYYLDIFNMRFDNFEYSIDASEETLLFKVPKLFLLPLIENSLKYGFKTRKDLMISIRVKKVETSKGTCLFFRLKDNGGGISKETIAKIQEDKLSNHHGLYNCRKRIMLMYSDSKFKVRSSNGHTIINIAIGDPHV